MYYTYYIAPKETGLKKIYYFVLLKPRLQLLVYTLLLNKVIYKWSY